MEELKTFDRNNFPLDKCSYSIGSGSLGGKAQGLVSINKMLTTKYDSNEFSQLDVLVPRFIVLRTDVFDSFMNQNNLYEIAYSDRSDERIAHAFQNADLPFDILGDLRTISNNTHTPLAMRSSSMLEDALYEPFAGIYATKMTPNNQHDSDVRFNKLIEAVKFVYASTYFKAAKDYMKATKHSIEDEKMAVIIQEVVGKRRSKRYYPELSGVARSYNFYPMGKAKHEDGVVNLALGLGKTIVDGGLSWTYVPSYPKLQPPYASMNDMLKNTQLNFWSVNMGKPPAYNPSRETEYMLQSDLLVAEKDETLKRVASTVDNFSGRLTIGVGADGSRVLTFAPLLQFNDIPINKLIKKLLKISEEFLDAPVEIEFAVTFAEKNDVEKKHQFGFLQVRPMVVSNEEVAIEKSELEDTSVLVASENVLGNGVIDSIEDIVFVNPNTFESKQTGRIAGELTKLNVKLVQANRPYLLIGFGRWGSSDPWLGIPVDWSNISGAKVIVEATLENMNVDLSQGSHFFHNLTSFNVSYFSVPFTSKYKINWEWLLDCKYEESSELVNHIKLSQPLKIKVDGKNGIGVIKKQKEL